MDDLTGYVSDDELAISPLNKLGWEIETISWRNKNVAWEDFEAVIIRTTWDYQKFPKEFLAALKEISAQTTLENSLKIVEWNLSKKYLRELEEKGIKIVPTIWDSQKVDQTAFNHWLEYFQTEEIIIKPIISATAENTFRLTEFREDLSQIFAEKEFMVQPFMPNIISEGEYSLFYFGGNYSHTICKSPKKNDFRVQEEHGGIITSVKPTNQMLETAEKILLQIPELPLYARVDLVRDSENEFCLMELELIEPALYLRMNENAPKFLAETIDNWLKK